MKINYKSFLPSIHIIFTVFIVIFSIGLYINTLEYDYIFDDHQLIEQNTIVKQGFSGIPQLLQSQYWEGTDHPDHGIYRPISLVTFALENEIFGYNPAISRLINILLYALSGAFIYLILVKLFPNKSPLFSFLTTLVFLCHPIHTEVLATIKGRAEILSLLFILLSVYYTLQYMSSSFKLSTNLGYGILISTFYSLALLSKEIAFSFIVLGPLMAFYSPSTTKPFLKNLAYVTCIYMSSSAFYLLARINLLGGISPGLREPIIYPLILINNVGDRLATALYILGKYLKLLIFPYPLSFDYSFSQIPVQHMNSLLVIVTIITLTILSIIGLKGLRSKSALSLGILISLTPLGILFYYSLFAGYSMADRLLYLPSLGYALCLVSIGWSIMIKGNQESSPSAQRGIAILAFCILCITFSIMTIDRSKYWKDELTLIQKDSHVTQNSCRAHYLLGTYLLKESRFQKDYKPWLITSIKSFHKAIKIHPRFTAAYYNIAIAYEELGFPHYAETPYKRSLHPKASYLNEAYLRLYEINRILGDEKDMRLYSTEKNNSDK